jgi:hypothetical protein
LYTTYLCWSPNEDESPPPLGFWTIITTTNRKQTIVIKTKKLKMCSLLNYCFVKS